MRIRSVGFVLIAVMAMVAAACGGDSDPTTTVPRSSDATTTSAVAATTTTTEAPAGSVPALVTFDGTACTVSGGPLDPGLREVLLLNTSPASADVLLLDVTFTLQLDTVAEDVAAGRYDAFNPLAPGEDGPTGAGGGQFNIMPANASEPSPRPFTATSGVWAVVCLQMSTSKAYMGSTVIEVAGTPEPPEATPALVTFDGTSCAVSGGPVEPGLSEISVLNTSSAGTEAHLIKLSDSYTLEDATADVASDRFDRWGLDGNDDPSGYDFTNVRMPQNASEPTVQPFTATTGSWAAVCLDFLNADARMGSGTFEVS